MKQSSVVVLINPDTGQCLGATRRGTNSFGLVGGKKDDNEAPHDAAFREFKEEVGIELIHEMDFLGTMIDGEHEVSIYFVFHPIDVLRVITWIGKEGRSIEWGIHVKFVPYSELIAGPFTEFNIKLIDIIFKHLI